LIGTAFAAPGFGRRVALWGHWRLDLPSSDFGSLVASGGPQGAATAQGAPLSMTTCRG